MGSTVVPVTKVLEYLMMKSLESMDYSDSDYYYYSYYYYYYYSDYLSTCHVVVVSVLPVEHVVVAVATI